MSPKTEDELDTMPEAELLALPGEGIPSGRLTALFTRRAALLHQQELDELALERSGNSMRHFIIFPDMDPQERLRREEEERRRALEAEREMEEYKERTDRLLAQIEEQQQALLKRRQEIEDKALRLHDGRRVYVDGDQYRDEQGNILQGRDLDEAADQRRQHPDASTWRDKKEIDDQYAEADRLKQLVLKDRENVERGGDVSAAGDRLSGYEKELAEKAEAKAAQPVADYGSGDYMAELGGDWKISTVPAFTEAAQIASHETIDQPSDREGESDETKKNIRPPGQGTLKL
jgi:hypothetical protein